MLLVIVGLALILLDIAIAPENTGMVIELLPDFIGYALVLIGIRREVRYGGVFQKAMIVSLCGAVAGAVLYAMKALGFGLSAAMTILLLEVFELLLMVVLLFLIVRAFRELEQDLQLQLKAKPLLYLWLCYTLSVAAAYIAQLTVSVGGIASLVSDLLAIAMLYLLYTNYLTLQEKE